MRVRQAISTDAAPRPIGPYSQAIQAGGLLFISGQGSVNPENQAVIDGDITAQTERTLRNISAILEAAGSGLDRVVRCTVYLKNMEHFGAMSAVYDRYLGSCAPARSTVEVVRLPKDLSVEIDLIALAH